jgi:hypothetical protein
VPGDGTSVAMARGPPRGAHVLLKPSQGKKTARPKTVIACYLSSGLLHR